jgi:acyl-CoA thioester hydrolase
MVNLEQLESLPLSHRFTIPREYLDLMGHMNVRWYMALFDEASWKFFATVGMDEAYYCSGKGGSFALQHFIRYLAEVRAGETVAIHTRILGRSDTRLHFMHFMINESTRKLATTLEALGAHADLTIRRIAPYPEHIATQIDAILFGQGRLDWEAPICGAIQL